MVHEVRKVLAIIDGEPCGPTLDQVNRQQVELLRRFRAAPGHARDEQLTPLLFSINGIAAAFGSTG